MEPDNLGSNAIFTLVSKTVLIHLISGFWGSRLNTHFENEIKLEILAIHFPGVKINPSQISCQIKDIKSTNVQKNISSKKDNYNNKKSSFSIFNLLLWLFFFPFKFAWWILKKIWNEKHI